MITGCREELKREGDGERGMEEGLMSGKVCLGEDWWRLIGVYVNKDLEGKIEKEKIENLRDWMEGGEEKT